MTDLSAQLPPEIDFSAFDFTNLTNSFLADETDASAAAGEKYLVFYLDEDLHAVASERVAEVAPMPTVAALPNAPEWLVGIANLRNEIVSVVNLRTLLKRKNSAVSPRSKLIVLRSPNDQPPIAFTVDRLSEIINLPTAKIQANADKASAFILGKAVHQANALSLIDTEKLLSALVI